MATTAAVKRTAVVSLSPFVIPVADVDVAISAARAALSVATAALSEIAVALRDVVSAFMADATAVEPMDSKVVYTNDPDVVKNSINTLEQLLGEDDNYKVVSFDLQYNGCRAGHDRIVIVTQLCVCHHVLVYHYCMATRPCERFGWFLNSPDYMFATMDTPNNLKVLKTLGLSCQTFVNIQDQYRVWGGEKKKQKDSMIDLAAAIIGPYYRYMKVKCEKDKSVWHKAWENELDEEHIKYTINNAFTSYEMYMRIVDMGKCLLPANGEGRYPQEE
ncbi:hypothetical protein D1007_57822 [Hordeum vulgare]|nr:hypothetical protein D1007_57822 [Hordeum vulgare]